MLECERALERGSLNLVGEMLREGGQFVEYEHHPPDDVYDAETGAQYYYHSHRGGSGEHGHFHTFMRQPLFAATGAVEKGKSATTHLIAISMDAYGRPIGLFATNRWVTDEVVHPADTVLDMMTRFRVDHAHPSWPANRWISAMLVLFRPHIEALLVHRDYVLAEWEHAHPGSDVFEDRELEITGYLPISVEDLVRDLRELTDWRIPPDTSGRPRRPALRHSSRQ